MQRVKKYKEVFIQIQSIMHLKFLGFSLVGGQNKDWQMKRGLYGNVVMIGIVV